MVGSHHLFHVVGVGVDQVFHVGNSGFKRCHSVERELIWGWELIWGSMEVD